MLIGQESSVSEIYQKFPSTVIPNSNTSSLSLRRLKNHQWVWSQKIPSCFKQMLPPHTAPWLPRDLLFSPTTGVFQQSFHRDSYSPSFACFLKNFFLLKDNCFTELCCFLSNLNMNQPQINICPLPFEPPSLTCLLIPTCSLGFDWSPSSSGGFIFHHIAQRWPASVYLTRALQPALRSGYLSNHACVLRPTQSSINKKAERRTWPGHPEARLLGPPATWPDLSHLTRLRSPWRNPPAREEGYLISTLCLT